MSGSLAISSRLRASRLEARPPACQEAERRVRPGVVARLPGPRRAGHQFAPRSQSPCPSRRNFQLTARRSEIGLQGGTHHLALRGTANGNGQRRLTALHPQCLREPKRQRIPGGPFAERLRARTALVVMGDIAVIIPSRALGVTAPSSASAKRRQAPAVLAALTPANAVLAETPPNTPAVAAPRSVRRSASQPTRNPASAPLGR